MGLRTDLVNFLVALPAIDSPDERMALIFASGHGGIRVHLDFQGATFTFFDRLLDFFGKGKQKALVEFLKGLGSIPHLGDDRRLVLAELREQLAALDTAAWKYEFATIDESASASDIIQALRNRGMLTRVATHLSDPQFRELLEITARVTLSDASDKLFRVYRATLPKTAHLLNSTTHSLLLADLCERPVLDSWPPLIEYIERLVLVDGIDAKIAKELQHWVDVNAPLIGPPTPASEIERLRREVRIDAEKLASSEAFSWLQIFLEPDPQNRTLERKLPLFGVELVLWSPQTNGALVLQSEQLQQDIGEAKRCWRLDELPLLLDQFFARTENVSLIPDLRRLVIEVVAPSDVLLYGFDRWKRNRTKNSYGAFHPLVVRLQDRLVIPFAADEELANQCWHRRWNVFRNSVCRQGCEELEWRTNQDLDVIELQRDMELACLGLSSPLVTEGREFFEVLRDAGIPIAIWIRGSDLGPAALENWPKYVMQLIQGKQLGDLRHVVHAVRSAKEVRADEGHVGNAVTLLWDEPDRPALKYGNQGVFV